MKKPQPQELVISIQNGIPNCINLSIPKIRPEIKNWIESNAAEFGDLNWSQQFHQYYLMVSPNYSTNEVLAYLGHAWAEAQAPVDWPQEVREI